MKTETALKQLKLLSKNQKDMRLAAESWKNNFKILISTILSARTRDEVTIPIAEKLFRKCRNWPCGIAEGDVHSRPFLLAMRCASPAEWTFWFLPLQNASSPVRDF